jgi:hypothetical protein
MKRLHFNVLTMFVKTLRRMTDMEYQVLYTNGRDVSACEYVTARSHMEAWSKGSARAQGRERVLHVFPVTNTYKEF